MTASVNKFSSASNRLLKEAHTTGKNITKAQVGTALDVLKADGKVSKADKEAASTFLAKAPLTAGAKEELQNFIKTGAKPSSDRSNSALSTRLRNATGGGESGKKTGGGESSGRTVHTGRTGGGESSGRTVHTVRTSGGESGGRTVRTGGGESSGGGSSTFGGGRVGGGE